MYHGQLLSKLTFVVDLSKELTGYNPRVHDPIYQRNGGSDKIGSGGRR